MQSFPVRERTRADVQADLKKISDWGRRRNVLVTETACIDYAKQMQVLNAQPGFIRSRQQEATLHVLDSAVMLYAELKQMDNLDQTEQKFAEKLKRREETRKQRERMKALTEQDRKARRRAAYKKYNIKRRGKQRDRELEIEELRQSVLGKNRRKKKSVQRSSFIDDEANEVVVEDDSEESEDTEEYSEEDSGDEYEYEPKHTGKHRKKRAVRSEDDEDAPMPQYRGKKKSSRSAPTTPYEFSSAPIRPLPRFPLMRSSRSAWTN